MTTILRLLDLHVKKKKGSQDSKKRVLADYKKVGSTFVPPLMHRLGPWNFVGWRAQTMTELVWWDVLMHQVSPRFAAKVAEELALHFKATDRRSHWWAFVSDYAQLSPEDFQKLKVHLAKVNVLDPLIEALRPFLDLYPECPLSSLLDHPAAGTRNDDYLDRFEERLQILQDKRSRNGVLVQAQVVYMALLSGRLHVKEGLIISDFPEVEHYPSTERSKQVGASVCAMVNMFAGQALPKYPDDAWVQYFWRRSLELRPLKFDHLMRPCH